MLVAVAGPISNLIIAVLSLLTLALASRLLFMRNDVSDISTALQILLQSLIIINIALAVFNLIPVPPLDGSHIANVLIPRKLYPLWKKFTSMSPWPLIIIVFLPQLFGISIVGWAVEFGRYLIAVVS